MASSPEFVSYICEQLDGLGAVRFRKMFGEYMVYLNDKPVVIVSNDFHLFRAKRIAQKQGFRHVEGLGSRTHLYTVPNSYAREIAAVIKYKICGQI